MRHNTTLAHVTPGLGVLPTVNISQSRPPMILSWTTILARHVTCGASRREAPGEMPRENTPGGTSGRSQRAACSHLKEVHSLTKRCPKGEALLRGRLEATPRTLEGTQLHL